MTKTNILSIKRWEERCKCPLFVSVIDKRSAQYVYKYNSWLCRFLIIFILCLSALINFHYFFCNLPFFLGSMRELTQQRKSPHKVEEDSIYEDCKLGAWMKNVIINQLSNPQFWGNFHLYWTALAPNFSTNNTTN